MVDSRSEFCELVGYLPGTVTFGADQSVDDSGAEVDLSPSAGDLDWTDTRYNR